MNSFYTNGFEGENLQRIYLGEPALVAGKPAEDRLSPKQHQIAELAASGQTNEDIGEEIGLGTNTVRGYLHNTYQRLGIFCRNDLAGFFLLEPNNPLLEGKKLSQQLTPRGARQLRILEGLSAGKQPKMIAGELSLDVSTIGTHIFNAKVAWPDCQKTVMLIRVANGVRANYARGIAENGGDISNLMGSLALHKLVDHEPLIRETLGLEP